MSLVAIFGGAKANTVGASVAPATTLTLSVPSTGSAGVAVTVTATPNGPVAGGGTATLSTTAGTLGSTTLTWSDGESAAKTTTLTLASAGGATVTLTTGMSLSISGSPASFTASLWASGAGTGSIASNVWTPAKTGGVINEASWNTVPTGTWTRVAGSNMDALDALIVAQMPDWRELASWDTYNNSWSGMAGDMAGGRVFYFGGGHTNGSNNGIYSYSIFRGIWGIEMLPSDQTLWTTEYKTGAVAGLFYEKDPDSARALNTDIAASTPTPINGWCQDEIYWDHGTGVGKKGSQHSYHAYTYSPATNELLFTFGRLWRFSLATGAYTYKRLFDDQPGTLRADGVFRAPNHDPEHGVAIVDEVTGELLSSSAGSSAIRNRFAYSLSGNTWTMNPTAYNPPWKDSGSPSVARVGRNITVVVPPYSPAGAGSYWIFNLDSRTTTTTGTSFTYGAGLTGPSDFKTNSYDAPGLEYIAAINRYWLYTMMADNSMAFIEIDPTTTPWTLSKKTDFTGSVPVAVAYGCKRMFYHSDTSSVWMYGATTAGWHVYKF